MKAMILAAGRGRRMGALVEYTPKPLLLVAGKPLISYHFQNLRRAGISEVVINVSYLAEKFFETLGDGSAYGIKIHYSFEPTALETGGGIYQALPLLDNTPFIVLSGDVWTDYPLQELPKKCTDLAHLILVDNPDFHPEGDFSLATDGKVNLAQTDKLTYASFGVLHPALFKNCTTPKFPLIDLLFPAIATGKITGEHYRGGWFNVGTVKELQELERHLTAVSE